MEVYTDPSAPSKPVDQLFRYLGEQVFAIIELKEKYPSLYCTMQFDLHICSVFINFESGLFAIFSISLYIFLMFLED